MFQASYPHLISFYIFYQTCSRQMVINAVILIKLKMPWMLGVNSIHLFHMYRSFYLYAGLSPPSSSLAPLQRTLAACRRANQAQKSAPKTLEKSWQKCSKFLEVKICQNDETYQNDAKWSFLSTLLMSIPLWGRRAKDGPRYSSGDINSYIPTQSVPVWRMGCDWCNGINGGYSSHLGLPATNGVGKKPIQSCLLVLFISSSLSPVGRFQPVQTSRFLSKNNIYCFCLFLLVEQKR